MTNDVTVEVGLTSGSASRRRWRRVAWVIVAVFALGFILQHHDEVPAAWRVVSAASLAWLALALALTTAWLVNLGFLHAASQRAVGLPTGARHIMRTAIGANFLNMITKSGGMAGLALLLANGRRRGVARGPVVAAYLLAAAFVELTFGATLVVALVVVWVSGRLTGAEIVASVLFAGYLSVRIAIVVVASRSRESLRRLFHLPRRLAAWLRRRPAREREHRAADELHEAMLLARRAPLRTLPAIAHAALASVISVLTLWSVVAAVGAGTGLAVAVVGYAVTLLFTIVGFLPSGVGFVEVSLGAVLLSFDVDGPHAAAAVVVYRVFQLWLPVVIGAVLAARVRSSSGVEPAGP